MCTYLFNNYHLYTGAGGANVGIPNFLNWLIIIICNQSETSQHSLDTHLKFVTQNLHLREEYYLF